MSGLIVSCQHLLVWPHSMVCQSVPIYSGTIVMYWPFINNSFAVRCAASSAGSFSVGSERLSLIISQKIVRGGREQMWDWILIQSNCQSDGLLRTHILLCNPDWDEPHEIAKVESRMDTGTAATIFAG